MRVDCPHRAAPKTGRLLIGAASPFLSHRDRGVTDGTSYCRPRPRGEHAEDTPRYGHASGAARSQGGDDHGDPVPHLLWTRRAQENSSCLRIERLRDRLLKQADERATLKLPVFEVSIETNDLGLFSGLTFVIVLSMLAYCLRREVANLQIALQAARQRDLLDEAYKYLSMSQVLTIPAESGRPSTWYWAWPTKAIYGLPLIVQLFGWYLDSRTHPVGRAISPFNTDFTTAYEIFFLVCIFGLVVLEAVE